MSAMRASAASDSRAGDCSAMLEALGNGPVGRNPHVRGDNAQRCCAESHTLALNGLSDSERHDSAHNDGLVSSDTRERGPTRSCALRSSE